jgi:hypothetical protein
MKTRMMEKGDVWTEVEGLKRREKRIWHIHPEKLREHIEKLHLHLERVATLKEVQDKILVLEDVQKGASGIYHVGSSNDTYCNHAVYVAIRSLDGNYRQFIGHKILYNNDDPPWTVNGLISPFKDNYIGYQYKATNLWCEILEEQAKNSEKTGICAISDLEAQEKANQGYVVVAAWKNKEPGKGPPHFATVRPDFEFDERRGPMLANVGAYNGIMRAKDTKAYGEEKYKYINWYYNQNQIFQDEFEKVKKEMKFK